MKNLYQAAIYEPMLRALTFIYENVTSHNLGLTIILITIIIRIILLPVFYKSAKQQTAIQKIQPKIKRIQEEHKDNKENQAKALMELYKEHKINPFSGIVLMFIQVPILLALYKVILDGVSNFDNLIFLGFIDLSQKNLILAGITALAQYYSGKLAMPKSGKKDLPASSMIIFIIPVITFGVLAVTPGAIAIYWLTSTLFSIVQQFFINKHVYGRDKEPNKNPD